jgi:hypothetical protein
MLTDNILQGKQESIHILADAREERAGMTREEAIRCLSVYSSTNGSGLCTDEQHYEAKQIAIKALEQEPCEDAISRQAVLDILKDKWNMFSDANDAMQESIDTIEALPNVTAEPKTGYISIDDVMSVFNDFMCGEVDEDGTDTFLIMLKDRAESEDKDA